MMPKSTILYKTIAELIPEHEREFIFRYFIELITQKPFSSFIIDRQDLSEEQQEYALNALNQYVHEHKPLAYIIGTIPFLDLTLQMQPPILIPRPETEEWVDQLIAVLMPHRDKKLTIVDVGTGSGCIVLALAKKFESFSFIAVDSSAQAFALAQQNAKLNAIQHVIFQQANLLEKIDQVDIIISNPPYISEGEYQLLEPSVKNWEDKQALVASDDGLFFLRTIIEQAREKLSNLPFVIPQLIMEVGYQQANFLKHSYEKNFSAIEIKKDFCLKDRVLYFYK